jgi:hypothetical protein
MGMYDCFFAKDDVSADLFRCGEGHALRDSDEMQTKDLRCDLDHYYVVDRRLFVLRRGGETSNHQRQQIVVTDGALRITTTEIAVADPYSGEVCLYASCTLCDPICFEYGESEVASWGGRLNHSEPRTRWTATFEHGQLATVQPIGCETREDVRQKLLLREGLTVLPDDDRVVKKHIALLRERDPHYRKR